MLRKPMDGRLFFEADAGAVGGNAGATDASKPATPPQTGATDAVTFTDAQQKELDRLIGNARQEGRDAEKKAALAAKAQADADAARQADIDKGEFDKAKASLETERDGIKAERDGLATKVTAYAELASKRVETLKGALPAEAVEDFPAEAEPLEQLAWLEARTALVAKLAPAATQEKRPVTPVTPKANAQNSHEVTSLISRHAI